MGALRYEGEVVQRYSSGNELQSEIASQTLPKYQAPYHAGKASSTLWE
jgi:hypothetical protein